ncbi:response regulator [Flavilitoribacter nigricans]|uniref:Response regulatory domain-containing protein n=1 Tax=Flavilitoribacter nigricans (strain ATCC 23147 / DSM 23189 / NBRC 102662 / NCIMB 1420 / SS-2) TaxID=1122177 RepID=A0A2D0N9H5_FLAN2|nr:response regulator [Flavilitoribacter nigricans]PHN05135.1 hypothetical protein CRP01_19125 [Flavilitoribacter nigricans DSM 23189 = NBRC 102662]
MYTIQAPKVLILESQLIIAADLSLQIARLGYEVMGIHARSEDALKTIAGNRPDIVLMNINLPGMEERIRTAGVIWQGYRIPVVFLSAYTGRELCPHFIQHFPCAFISKPFKIRDLQSGLEAVLGRLATNHNPQ